MQPNILQPIVFHTCHQWLMTGKKDVSTSKDSRRKFFTKPLACSKDIRTFALAKPRWRNR